MANMDVHGNSYARIQDLKVGDRLCPDDGFTCMLEGDIKDVREDEMGLYVACTDGGAHYLDGQVDDEDGFCVGLTMAK